ncbi:MAG: hypothetical protein BJ554DRAFT_571 [Olpidium bornovanus]|uniref:Kinetochore protein Nuf2 N-terminal domain-containing protein n=1 Tax=Olpidium bornovanus TaxID=278681 RepID=A0A8H8DIG9_9FUNG|nr:MAG: hypothetical protein BJ554DRAFT_571 [Olpidium bornovanus]
MLQQTPAPLRPQAGLAGRAAAGAGAAGGQGLFSFPNMRPADVISCLAELHVTFTLDDFDRPSAQKMATLYERVAELLLGVVPDQFSLHGRCDDLFADVADFPDTLADSVGQLAFFREL